MYMEELKEEIIQLYKDKATKCQKNFINKENLKRDLIKDFSLTEEQIKFDKESVLITIDNQTIRIKLLIDPQEIRIINNQ